MPESGANPLPIAPASDAKEPDFTLALTYMQMARTEILSRVESSNKTLVAYVGAASAVITFFYNANLNGFTVGDRFLSSCGVLAYLSVGAMWVIRHQETMITSLARYQKCELSAFLPPRPHMWEKSDQLRKGDGLWWSTGTIAMQAVIILLPIVLTFGGALHFRNITLPGNTFLALAIVMGIIYDVAMVAIMLADRRDLRRKD